MGYVTCVSCGKVAHWKIMQAGHYVSRSHYSVRYDLRNIHVQCVKDNIFLKGNYPAYTKFLLETYGQKWLERLIKDGEQIKQWSIPELKEQIEHFTHLLKTL